ncbi:EAL domain-containing protein [Psychrobacillus sp. FSL K6-2836]|uniref:EAL domain-containing protein n=1 Tax=Psychrobacillus sp. FSL K6-2836 TaxID=2921548 RepID=UPI0030FA1E9C
MHNSSNKKLAISDYLLNVVKENPSIPTYMLKRDEQNGFSVIYVNDAAISIFQPFEQSSLEAVSNQLQTLIVSDEKCGIHQNIPFTIQKKQYTYDVTIILIEDGIETIYGVTMYDRTKDENEKSILKGYKEKYLSLFNNNLDPIILVCENGNILDLNAITSKILDYDPKILVGQSIEQLIEENSMRNFQLMMKQTLTGYATEIQNCLIRHVKGHYLPMYIKAIPMETNNNVSGFYLVLRETATISDEQEQLYYLAYHDHLTGLWNRRALKEHLRDTLVNAEPGSELSVVRIDLDRFKMINESLGYNYGDELLKKIADRLGLYIDKSSNLYRQSGDEFVFIITDKSRDETSEFAENILIELSKPLYLDHQEYFVTASIGISMYPYDGKKMDELLIKADQALYIAKDRGRAHYRYYQEQMNLAFPNDALMESHLRRAIEKEEFSIHYQPQVNLVTGEINSFEALLRWNNRKFGYVSPMNFIPIAEESGMIMQIGDWVLEEVCIQLKYWQEKGYRPVRIAVNISPKQFIQDNFAMKIHEKIQKYNISPSSLEVEITESAMTDMQDTFTTLKELKDIGVFISIDDFGTGYSSLSYLKKYPIDIIKIDQSFIKDMELDDKNAAIATTIIQLAHSLGMEVIAEGVEKDRQVEILKSANCQKAQGYLFSKPIPIEHINESYMQHVKP